MAKNIPVKRNKIEDIAVLIEKWPIATPNICKAVVPQINPKTNNKVLAAAGTSIP